MPGRQSRIADVAAMGEKSSVAPAGSQVGQNLVGDASIRQARYRYNRGKGDPARRPARQPFVAPGAAGSRIQQVPDARRNRPHLRIRRPAYTVYSNSDFLCRSRDPSPMPAARHPRAPTLEPRRSRPPVGGQAPARHDVTRLPARPGLPAACRRAFLLRHLHG